jgi:rare lipoprotein A
MTGNSTRRHSGVILCVALLAACGEDRDDTAGTLATDTVARPAATAPATTTAGGGETGTATVYAAMLEGRQTAGGEPFNHDQHVAAHRSHPMGTHLRVTNLDNNQSVTVRVVDRIPEGTDAAVDLSRSAAREIGIDEQGRAEVRVEVVN